MKQPSVPQVQLDQEREMRAPAQNSYQRVNDENVMFAAIVTFVCSVSVRDL